MAPAPAPYDEAFYAAQFAESLAAARVYAARLAEAFAPESVLDVGCGRGAWLKALGEAGAARLVGLDGPWNEGRMADPAIEFRQTDLAAAARTPWQGERFDLALSLEVAEHLPRETSAGFVALLCAASDAVLFGAAVPHQTGTDHVNLRWQSEWAQLFAAEGYRPWDLFRPAVWGNPAVPYWYQQNSFLYVREGHPLETRLTAMEVTPIERPEAMDVVHPALLEVYASPTPATAARRLAKQLLGRA